MNIIELKSVYLTARREGNIVSRLLLNTLISEVEKRAKDDGNREVADLDIVTVARRFLNDLVDNLVILEARNDMPINIANTQEEIRILKGILPKEVSQEDLQADISALGFPLEMKSMGLIKKALQEKYGAGLDVAAVSLALKGLMK